MAFVTGLVLLDAPASALNNAGAEPGGRTDNKIVVKSIPGPHGLAYPYVSAQAVRYWVRTSLQDGGGWSAAPVFREKKIAYTDANPILWDDDDLFGYMRAQSKRSGARDEEQREGETPTSTEITRVSPLRVSTFVSLGPVRLVDDFGTMARHDGDPVPHEHQLYRTTLRGLVSLDLGNVGTLYAGQRVGFRNLDEHRVALAEEQGLERITRHGQRAYRMPVSKRTHRAGRLVEAFGRLEGGAKLALHYTDVTPAFAVCAVTAGGNHPFYRVVRPGRGGEPEIDFAVLEETLSVFRDDLLSDLYIGWPRGFMDGQREAMEEFRTRMAGQALRLEIRVDHPKRIFEALAQDLNRPENATWFE